MQAPVYNLSGEQVSTVELDDFIFGITPNNGVMHQALVRQHANARQGTASTKTRSEVSYTTKKAYRQKGTGNARQGNKSGPHWRHGGVAFGPKPRKYTKDMPRQMRRLAIRSALSVKAAEDNLVFVEGFDNIEPKTKAMIKALQALNVGTEKVLVLVPETSALLYRAAANLPGVKPLVAQYVNMHDMFKYEKVVIPVAALEVLNGFLSQAVQRHNGRAYAPETAVDGPEVTGDAVVNNNSASMSFRANDLADSGSAPTSTTIIDNPIVLEVPSISVDTAVESGNTGGEVMDAGDVEDNQAV